MTLFFGDALLGLFEKITPSEALLTGLFGLVLIFLATRLQRFSRARQSGRQNYASEKTSEIETIVSNLQNVEAQRRPAEMQETAQPTEHGDYRPADILSDSK